MRINLTTPTPHICKKYAPKYAIQWGFVWHKSWLKSRDFYRKYGIRSQLLWHTNPPLLCHMNRFLLGVGVVSNLLRNGCVNFMDAWKNAFCLQEKPMSTKFLALGGGILGFWRGGGECRFYFYGRADFFEYTSGSGNRLPKFMPISLSMGQDDCQTYARAMVESRFFFLPSFASNIGKQTEMAGKGPFFFSAAAFWGFSRGGFPENACIGGAISERNFCEIRRRKSPHNTEKHTKQSSAQRFLSDPFPKTPFFSC